MFDGKLLQRTAILGIVLELTMVVAGHYVAWIRINFYEFGAMMFAGLAGLLYARDFAQGYAKGALGGAVVGGTSGLIGISAANLLGHAALIALPVGTAITILVGAIGGLWGQMGANIRAMGRGQR